MGSVNVDEEETVPKKNFKIFGRDIADIPCFRNSFICGICTGVAGGLIAFMITSKAIVSSHSAFASLWIGVFAYWIPCRYKYETKALTAEQWKQNYRKIRGNREKESSSEESSSANLTEEKK